MDTFKSKSVMIWSAAISLLVVIASILGLTDPTVYRLETQNWAIQGKGQDIGNLLAVGFLLVSGYLFSKGSFKAALVWLGTLFYFVYAYVVYAMAVHFNYLFLVYVAALGLSSFAIMFYIGRLQSVKGNYPDARKLAAFTLLGVGFLFGLLWLSEVVPAVLSGQVPQSLKDAGLWVNPIHVIDLAVVLPGFILAGYWLLKRHPNGFFYAVPWLAFSVLMGSSIVAAMVMMGTAGFSNIIPAMVMVAIVVGLSAFALWRYARRITT